MTCIRASTHVPLLALRLVYICVVKAKLHLISHNTRRGVLDSLELLNGAGWSAVQHRAAVIDSVLRWTRDHKVTSSFLTHCAVEFGPDARAFLIKQFDVVAKGCDQSIF